MSEGIGERLRFCRKISGMTQTHLALASGLQASEISKWERKNRLPGTGSIIKLAIALDVSADYLLNMSDSMAFGSGLPPSLPHDLRPLGSALRVLPVHREAGVYFLVRDKSVVYVGQSVNAQSRIEAHVREAIKDFSVAYILSVPKSDLDRIETAFILCLKPEYNATSGGGRITAPMKMTEAKAMCLMNDVISGRVVGLSNYAPV